MVKALLKKMLALENDKDVDEFEIDGQVKIEVKDEDGKVKDKQTHDL